MDKTNPYSMLNTPEQIQLYRLAVLIQRLKIEIVGLKFRGPTTYMVIKKEFGLTGSKQIVLAQLENIYQKRKEQLLCEEQTKN